MDVTMTASTSKSVKRDFMNWATRWFYADIHEEEQKNPDIASLICLFQSIGYHLRTFEKSEDVFSYLSNNSVKITLECGSSRMRAILESSDVECKCPNTDDRNDASYWSVTATKPLGSIDSINKFEETGSSLLPRVPKNNQELIHDVIHFLLRSMENQGNAEFISNNFRSNTLSTSCLNLSAGLSEIFASSRGLTQPELVVPKFKAADGISKGSFSNNAMTDEERRKTIAGKLPVGSLREPSTKSQYGSVKNLCSQFSQISKGNKNFLTVAECLRRAKYYIEKAQAGGGPPMSNDDDDLDDGVFVKPTTPIAAAAATNRPSSLRKSPGIVPKREITSPNITSTNYLTTKSTIDGKVVPRRSVSGFLLTAKQKELSPATMRRTSMGLATSASQLKLRKSNTVVVKPAKLQLEKKSTISPKCSTLMRTSTLKSIGTPTAMNTTLTLSSGTSRITPGKKTSSLAASCGSLNTQTPKNRLVPAKNAVGSLSTGKKSKSGTGIVSSSTKAR